MTKSGNIIKLKRSLKDRWQSFGDKKLARKAEILKDLPKSRIKRFFYHLQPKRIYRYWFSRKGGIMALKITGIGIVVIFLLMVAVFAYFRKDLPDITSIAGKNIGGSILYYDRTGQTLLWEDHDGAKRIPVQSNQIANSIKLATVAVEDRDFYKHGGFDLKGIVRAGWSNITGGSTSQGGSTITQQLVKLTQNWTGNRTYTRKIKELILSVELERSYTKDQILTGYLNTAPYGGTENGVEAAAQDYFRKSAVDLTLDESAFLAAIPKSPRYYSPYSPDFDRTSFTNRKNFVLDVMYSTGKITKAQRDQSRLVDVLAKVKTRPNRYDNIKAPYFVLTAKQALENKYSENIIKQGGWKVITTVDLGLQKIAEEQVQKGLAQIRRQGGDTAAFSAEDVTTGQVVALVGGVDFTNPVYGEYNFARAPLPPGSSFKPYDYSALMDNTTNFGAGSVLYDTQGPLPGYPCTNKALPKNGGNCLQDYDFRNPGPLTIRYALGGSRNIPAVKAMLTTGIDKTINVADRLTEPQDGRDGFGYKCYKPGTELVKANEDTCFASSAIGDGAYIKLDEHVHGMASISRNGVNLPQTYILKITDSNNKVIEEWKPSAGKQEVRADAAYIVADMLSDPNASYFNAGLKPHRFNTKQGTWKFGMKTGTTNDGKDGWMLGFSTKYAAGVWVGYHTRSVTMSGFMETMTLPIWNGFMKSAHQNLTPVERVKPATVQTLPAYVVTSHVGIGSVEPSPSTDLFPSWYKPKKTQTGAKQVIDIVSNKLATECTPDRAKKEITSGTADSFSGDTFAGTAGANTDQTDDVHNCADTRPSIILNSATATNVNVDVTAGSHPLDSQAFKGTINVLVDGQVVQSSPITASAAGLDIAYSYNGSGDHTVTAQVIDSVLYDSTSGGKVVTFTGGLTIINPKEGSNFTNNNSALTVNWSGGGPNYSVFYNNGSSEVESCTNTSDLFCVVTLTDGQNGPNQQIRIITANGTAYKVNFTFNK